MCFRTFFRRFFSQHLLLALIGFCWQNCFTRFFPPFFGHDIRVNIKIVFSHFFQMIFSYIFFSHYSCDSGLIVSRVFFPAFFGIDIRLNIKNVFSHFFPTIFSQHFLMHYSCVSEKLFRSFFPFFWSRFSCEYKKRFFLLFSDDFFLTFFARTIRVFLEKF